MILITARGLIATLRATLLTDGQQTPSSDALSASATKTNFSAVGKSKSHALLINLIDIGILSLVNVAETFEIIPHNQIGRFLGCAKRMLGA